MLDDLLTQNPPTDIRFQALDGKGEALFTLAANEPKMYEQAIGTFDTLLSSEGLTTEWKQQALYQKGKCFEKLGKLDDALSNYYDVLAARAEATNSGFFGLALMRRRSSKTGVPGVLPLRSMKNWPTPRSSRRRSEKPPNPPSVRAFFVAGIGGEVRDRAYRCSLLVCA